MNLEDLIEDALPKGSWKIFSAMAYTPKAGGKRLRSKILLKSAEDLGVPGMESVAVAIELFHSGTLVHDDLPEIDDAKLRRGLKTNHMVFGQGMAVLAGDGLFFRAFSLMSSHRELIGYFSDTAFRVLVGEAMDVEMESIDVDETTVLDMYREKTGALFGFSFSAPALKIGDPRFEKLKGFGEDFGIAFQMFDDVKDVISSTEDIGKDVGKDLKKKTIVKFWGVDKTLEKATSMYENVIDGIRSLGLSRLADYLEGVKEAVMTS